VREGRKKHTAARGDRTAVSAIIPDNDSNPNRVVAYLCLSERRELRLLLTVLQATTIDSMWRKKGLHFLVGDDKRKPQKPSKFKWPQQCNLNSQIYMHVRYIMKAVNTVTKPMQLGYIL